MTRFSKHIISRLKWDTQVSERQISFELQNRISEWSNTIMVKEIKPLLEKYCPENMTWRLDQVELDLGVLDYDNLEEELSTKLVQSLSEYLSSLLIKSKYEDIGLEIFDDELNDIQMVTYFLKNGILPWYNTADGRSMNQIVTELFQSQRIATNQALKELVRSLRVRKRLVWQFGIENIKHVIQGLEPTNSEFIFSFSSSMQQIQKEENIVKTNATEFSKGVWLWILNHLVEERGTLFNMVAFVKSTIAQMANHYNVSYEALLTLIIKATKQNKKYAASNATLISALKVIEGQAGIGDITNTHKQEVERLEAVHLKKVESRSTQLKARRVERLLLEIIDRLKKGEFYTVRFARLQAEWNRVVESNPKLIYRMLTKLKKKRVLNSIPSALITKKQMTLLANEMEWASDSEIGRLFDAIKNIERTSSNGNMIQIAIDQLHKICVSKLVSNNKKIQRKLEGKVILLELLMSISKKPRTELFGFIKSIDKNKSVSKYLKDSMLLQLIQLEDEHDLVDFALKYLECYGESKETILDFLNLKVDEKSIDVEKIIAADVDMKLLDVLLPVSLREVEEWMNSIVRSRLLSSLNQSKKSINKALWKLVWYSVLSGSRQDWKNKEDFFKMLDKGIQFQYFRPSKVDLNTAFSEKEGKSVNIQNEEVEKIKKGLKGGAEIILINMKKLNFQSYLVDLVENDPMRLRNALQDLKVSDKVVKRFKNYFDIATFFSKMNVSNSGLSKDMIHAFEYLIFIISELNKTENISFKFDQFWEIGLKIFSSRNPRAEILKAVKITLDLTTLNGLSTDEVVDLLHAANLTLPPILKKLFSEVDHEFADEKQPSKKTLSTKIIEDSDAVDMLDELTMNIILNDQVPAWYRNVSNDSKKEVIVKILTARPSAILEKIKSNRISDASILKLVKVVSAENIIGIIQKRLPHKSHLLNKIRNLMQWFGRTVKQNHQSTHLDSIMSLILLKSWAHQDWRLLSVEYIWGEVERHLGANSKGKWNKLLELSKVESGELPEDYASSFEAFRKESKSNNTAVQEAEKMNEQNLKTEIDMEEPLHDGILVQNAGLVILNNYIPMLFDRLELLKDGDFKDEDCKIKAVQYLHFLGSGSVVSEEHMLTLNKLICGLSVSEPIPSHADISEDEKELMNGLINAAISHWSVIGDSSVDGFRGNWMVREGLLTEMEDKWELQVEKKAYDLLLNQSPFSFSVIKYEWMPNPIHVQWAY